MGQEFQSAHWYRVSAVRPRLAPELRAQRQTIRGTAWYVLFDPLNQRTHRLTPEAWFVVSRMDGRHTVEQLWQAAVDALGEKAPPQDELIQLLSQLHEADALASDAMPDMDDQLRRRDRQRRQQWLRNLKNPMALRFRLWDPDSFLLRTLPAMAWLLGPVGALLWLAVVLPAGVLAWQNWGEIAGNASDALLSASSLLTMAVVYPGVKFIHEMSHAYAARRHGAEVHDMGLMFLVFAPVPYVDASGSAAFPRRSQRALVAGIGMLAELFLAALALWVWLAVEPGLVRSLAFSVMVLGGLSTLLFNGNPLLRFDGYFVLCDAIEVPNLAQRSNAFWIWLIKRYAFGLEQARKPEAVAGEGKWLAAYAPLSLGYRLSITLGIAIFLGQEYLYLGLAIGTWGMLTQFVWPLLKGLRWLWAGTDLVGRRLRPALVTTVFACALAVGLLGIPAPHSTYAQGVVWPAESAQLRAEESGFVAAVRGAPGQPVGEGALVLALSNDQLERDLETAQAREEQARARWQAALAATRTRVDAAGARVELAVATAALHQAEDEHQHALRKQAGLRVVAQRDGVLALPLAADLPGRWLRKGENVGHLRTDDAPTVRVVVTQDDIDGVRAGPERIQVRLAGDLGETVPAQLVREVPGGDSSLPSLALALEHGGTVAVDPRQSEEPRALNRVFQFDLALPETVAAARIGERAHVRFVLDDEPLGLQGWRRLRQLLLSKLTL
ncbi:MAG: peptidase M50 [Variovorax paradoxus]|nr:MAG: peptidase M50 [Variovorax paradoxus]PZQ16836.1 MAG: peptidase M50 [Variovorax paradoxus]